MLTTSLRCSRWGWSVCRRDAALISRLSLQRAIELARAVARDKHRRSRRPVRVEMAGTCGHVVLTRFAIAGDGRGMHPQ
ncbi:MAG: hypothetical protein ACTHJO_10315 [Rhodanobacter sp.]